MARKPRLSLAGFYHIINRGVEKRDIFLEDADFIRFLSIVDEYAKIYDFEIYSFCLMRNHYHLLIKTNKYNISTIMKQINMKFAIYFNKKYKRVGPLWQGRFRSKYVWESSYLEAIVKYVEYNPIRAGIVANIGDYKFSMSSRFFKFDAFNYELINKINLKEFNDNDWKKVDDFFNSKVKIKNNKVNKIERKKLDCFFNKFEREKAIIQALKNGYTQSEIGQYLGLSVASISKIKNNYKNREKLFNKLRDKGIFWSFDKKIEYENFNDNVFIVYVLKYGDFDDIKEILSLFGRKRVKKVWARTVAPDKRFIKINLMIARVFFNMDVEADYFNQ
jgi:putative transposase